MDILEPPAAALDQLDAAQPPARAPRRRHTAQKVRAIADALLAGHSLEEVAKACEVNTRMVYAVRSGDHPALTHQRRRALVGMFGAPRRRVSAKARRRAGMMEAAVHSEGEQGVCQAVLTMITDLQREVGQMAKEMAALQELMRAVEPPPQASLSLRPPAENSDRTCPWWAFWRRS